MLGIIVAIEDEVEYFLNNTVHLGIYSDTAVTFYHLAKGKKEFILAKSGAGKVNASMAATIMLEKYDIQYIINTGIAGGIGELNIGGIIIAASAVHHDVNMSSHRNIYRYGQVRGLPFEFKSDQNLVLKFQKFLTDKGIVNYVGTIASGDCFVNNDQCLEKIKKESAEIIGVDMESASIGQVCHLYNVPFISVRIISDIITSQYKDDEFNINIKNVCTILGRQVLDFVCYGNIEM
jgi:adenosylhomocysteine nucleosidase